MTVAVVVPEAARRFGDRAAFVAQEGWELSFAELDRISDEVAAGMAARGVGPGDVVALALPSTPDYAVAYAAAAKLGAITTGVNDRYTAHERAEVLAVARPRLTLATPALTEGAGATGDLLVVERAASAATILPALRTTAVHGPTVAEAADPDRLVAIVFTSGTTGRPKGAVFANRELDAITTTDLGGDRWGSGGHAVIGTPFPHIGFMAKFPGFLRLGSTSHLLDRWRAADVLRLVAEHRIPVIGGVAPQMALLLRVPDFDEHDLDHVTGIVMGGAFSPPWLVEEARRRFGAGYSIRYSSTESGGVGTATAFDADDEEALYTVGRPRGDYRIAIRDEQDRDVPAGEVGEICLHGSCMMRGYWNDPEATASTLRPGPDGALWLHSGDLGRIDDEGRLRMAGRSKDMYIRGGFNVFPAEVEAVLGTCPGVREVAVVPRPDRVMGEIGVAVVVPTDPAAPPTLDELRAHAAARLAAFKLPEALRVVDALPLTPMVKIDRRALAAHEQAHAATGTA